MSKPFDPREHLRLLDNGSPYLDVKWRVHWMRSEHPDGEIETEMISVDDERAVFKAVVRVPGGGAATGHASANRAATASYIETAETRAIGRALAALGYGAEFVEDDQAAGRSTERPVSLVPNQPAPPLPASSTPPAQPRVRPMRTVEDRPEPEVTPEPAPAPSPAPASTPRRETREVRETPAPTNLDAVLNDLPTPMTRGSDIRSRQESQPRGAERADREDVSWTKFWEWAKRHGYRDANHLKDLLGIDVNALTPGEVRDHIRRYEVDHPPEKDES
jgi:hypothetical protein